MDTFTTVHIQAALIRFSRLYKFFKEEKDMKLIECFYEKLEVSTGNICLKYTIYILNK